MSRSIRLPACLNRMLVLGLGIPLWLSCTATVSQKPDVSSALETSDAQLALAPAEVSVAAVNGDRGRKKSLTEVKAFLFGHDVFKRPLQIQHAPAHWKKTQLHKGMKASSVFFSDRERAEGLDDDLANGIENHTALFYVGHGEPDRWSALKEWAYLDHFVGGDEDLRYLLMCSCNVVAHGENTGTDDRPNYTRPWTYSTQVGPVDSQKMRNAYLRWDHAFGPNLQLVCGGSSSLCSDGVGLIDGFWNHYGHTPVAEAFLHASLPSEYSAPLCIARAGDDWDATPLDEMVFTVAEPTGAPSRPFTYLLYAEPVPLGDEVPDSDESAAEDRDVGKPSPPTPELPYEIMPVLELAYRADSPEELDEGWQLDASGQFLDSEGDESIVRFDPSTGSWRITGQSLSVGDPAEIGRNAEVLLDLARNALRDLPIPGGPLQLVLHPGMPIEDRWTSPGEELRPESVYVVRMERSDDRGADVEGRDRSATVVFRRWMPVEIGTGAERRTEMIRVLGPGGRVLVQVSPAGELVFAQAQWHPLSRDPEGRKTKSERVLSYDEALGQARQQLDDPDGYELSRYDWGYREESAGCVQTSLSIAYEFHFEAIDPDLPGETPAVSITVPAQRTGMDSPKCRDFRPF